MEIYKIFIDQKACLIVQTHVVVIEQLVLILPLLRGWGITFSTF